MKTSRINELEKLIKYHDNLYWNENEPEISDEEYDKLIQELKLLDSNNPLLQKLSGSTYGQKVQHEESMLSLDKVYSVDELLIWAEKISRNNSELFSIEPKFDGWSGQYTNRTLYTRGDDGLGQNISDKIPIIKIERDEKYTPLKNHIDNERGEIIMKKSTFSAVQPKIKRKDGQLYKTERSILAGLLRTKETQIQFGEILTFLPYDSYGVNFSLQEMKSLDWKTLIDNIKQSDYPTDGLVIKLKDLNYSQSLGVTAHHPRGQIALKYGNPIGTSKLLNIEWFVGKNNTLNPVAIIEPCIIAGHTISKVNLHNAQNIIDININIGDLIVVERCGEIIPQITKVIPGEKRTPISITSCPQCGSSITFNSPFLYCENSDCGGALSKKLTDTCWRLGIENIGQSTINKLIDNGVENIIDILNITLQELFDLDRFGIKSASNLYDEIHKVKTTPIEEWRILSSLNINGIGDTLSKELLSKRKLNDLRSMDLLDLEKIPMIGQIRAHDLYLGLDENSQLLDDLYDILTIKQTTPRNITKGKVCFTGKMPNERAYYEKLAEDNGFTPTNTVTSDLTYLICQDITSTKGKMKKAQSLGINIITLNQFFTIIGK